MRFKQFKPDPIIESLLNEVEMSTGALEKWASSDAAEGMLMGIEFEMLVPDTEDGSRESEPEPDYDMDNACIDIDDILQFFRDTLYYSRRKVSDALEERYHEWLFEQAAEHVDSNSREMEGLIRQTLEDDYDMDNAIKQAKEELGDDAEESEIEELADDIKNEDIRKILNDADSRDYENAYEYAREMVESDFYDSGDASQTKWLESLGIDLMSDAEREFSEYFNWPHYSYPDDIGTSIERVAEDWEKVIGVRVNYARSYHEAKRRTGEWAIEPDSSVSGETGDAGLEFISPAEPIAKTLASMEKLWNWARENNCYTNRSTGLHINISVPDFSVEKLDYVKLALFIGDEYVLDQFSRTANGYCKSATEIIKRKIGEQNALQVLEKMREHMNVAASKFIHSGLTDKYTSINTQGKYVEFRGPGGDYLNMNPTKIANTALRLAMGLQIACDENAYRKEYAKKLYKLISPQTSDNNVVDLFSRYSAKELDRYTLVSRLQEIQKQRQTKKEAPTTKPIISGRGNQLWKITHLPNGNQTTRWARSGDEGIEEITQWAMQLGVPISNIQIEPINDREPPGEHYQYYYVTDRETGEVYTTRESSVTRAIQGVANSLTKPVSNFDARPFE